MGSHLFQQSCHQLFSPSIITRSKEKHLLGCRVGSWDQWLGSMAHNLLANRVYFRVTSPTNSQPLIPKPHFPPHRDADIQWSTPPAGDVLTGAGEAFFNGAVTLDALKASQAEREDPGNAPPMRALPLAFLAPEVGVRVVKAVGWEVRWWLRSLNNTVGQVGFLPFWDPDGS